LSIIFLNNILEKIGDRFGHIPGKSKTDAEMKHKEDQVRIFITDFEDVYRKGIRWALAEIDSFEVTGEATTNIETLESILKTPVDLLIMNTDHNKPSGIDVARYVSHKLPDVKVILMMDEYSTEHVVGAMKSGVKACINKSIDLDGLIQTIKQVIRDELPVGHYLLKPKVADFILKEYDVSDQVTEKTDKASIRLVKSEEMILNWIRENTSLTDLVNSLGVSEEIITDYLDEIAEKLVKVEYYNETPGQRYIGNLVSKHLNGTTGEKNERPGDRSAAVQTGEVKSNTSGSFSPYTGTRFDGKERASESINKQTAGLNESVKEISEVVELAKAAGRLSSIHEFNQYIMSMTEGLMTEIDRRRRILRKIRKAIAFELEFTKDPDISRN
jgi:DNA-binding NarL/FixJ family response regulator